MNFSDSFKEEKFVNNMFFKYGNFGVALFNISKKNNFKIPAPFAAKPEEWVTLFFRYVHNLFKKSFSLNTYKNTQKSASAELLSKFSLF